MKAFSEAAGATLADLLTAGQHDPRRWSYRLLTTASFTGGFVSYTDFMSVIRAAEAGDLIERHRGHYQRFDFGEAGTAGRGLGS